RFSFLALKRNLSVLIVGDFRHAASCSYAGKLTRYKVIAATRMFILDLAKQPVFPLLSLFAAHSYEQPFPFHPLAAQNEMQMAFFQIINSLALDQRPCSFVP